MYPFLREGSIAETPEQRMRTHVIRDLGSQQMKVFTPRTWHAFVEEKLPPHRSLSWTIFAGI
jgi:hypothetical protein